MSTDEQNQKLSDCRRRILATLGDSEWTGTELEFALRRLRTNIARDLRLMRDLGLVESRRDGVCVFWRAVQCAGHPARLASGETT
jgi:predicted transcriptional regulator